MSSESEIADSTELWKLVSSLQKEKEELRAERDMWREKFLTLTGLGDVSYNPGETEGPPAGAPLGKHVSILSLRARHEIRSRQLAAEKLAEEKRS